LAKQGHEGPVFRSVVGATVPRAGVAALVQAMAKAVGPKRVAAALGTRGFAAARSLSGPGAAGYLAEDPGVLQALNRLDIAKELEPGRLAGTWLDPHWRRAILQAMDAIGLVTSQAEAAYHERLSLAMVRTAFSFSSIANFVTKIVKQIEIVVSISTIISLCFASYIMIRPFFGHKRIYEAMQRGAHNEYQGGTSGSVKAMLRSKLDYACFYPGTFFSTVVSAYLLIWLVLTVALILVLQPLVWKLALSFWPMIGVLAITLFLKIVILKKLVLGYMCVKNGEISKPRLFSCVYFIFLCVNFVLGLLGSIIRAATLLPLLFVQFCMLDTTLLPDEFMSFDIGYCSFLTVLKVGYDKTNPIKVQFLNMVLPGLNDLHGEKPKLITMKSAKERGIPAMRPRSEDPERPPRRTQRNRWQLALRLYQLPQLRDFRGHAIKERVRQQEHEAEDNKRRDAR